MKLKFSPAAFSIIFCCAYMAVFALGKPMFRFYPVRSEWAWGAAAGDPVVRTGAPIVWFGLLASATLIASVVAFVVRDPWLTTKWRGWLWIWPWLGAAGCLYLLRVFFV